MTAIQRRQERTIDELARTLIGMVGRRVCATVRLRGGSAAMVASGRLLAAFESPFHNESRRTFLIDLDGSYLQMRVDDVRGVRSECFDLAAETLEGLVIELSDGSSLRINEEIPTGEPL